MRERFLMALIAPSLRAAGVDARKYAIKIKSHAGVGQSVVVAESVKLTIVYSMGVGDNVLKEEKKVISQEKEYTEKVLQIDGKRATKRTRTYRKVVATGDDDESPKPCYVGKKVTFERKGDKFEATAEGVTEKDLRALAKDATSEVEEPSLAPKEEVPVGGTWALDKQALAALAGQMWEGMDLDSLKATAKLLKVYPKDGQQWGTIDLDITAAIKKFGPLKLTKPLPFKMKLAFDTPIDGSSTANRQKGTATVKGTSDFEQAGQTITVTVSPNAEVRHEQSKEK